MHKSNSNPNCEARNHVLNNTTSPTCMHTKEYHVSCIVYIPSDD